MFSLRQAPSGETLRQVSRSHERFSMTAQERYSRPMRIPAVRQRGLVEIVGGCCGGGGHQAGADVGGFYGGYAFLILQDAGY
jgi:hypothetical protein